MGTHVSKVKSLTLDTWSKEQVEVGLTRHETRLCADDVSGE
jgi:hypothetical protein